MGDLDRTPAPAIRQDPGRRVPLRPVGHTISDVYARLARGDIFYFEFTVPEGNNIFDIAASLEQQGIMPAADFQNAASDPASIHDLAPNAPSLEGFLFPSTYRISHSTTAPSCASR